MKEKHDIRPHTFGLSLLLVVFLILCLLTFAAISIAGARNDLTGAQLRVEKKLAYNSACDMAEAAIRDFTNEAALDPENAEEQLDFSVAIDENDELAVSAALITKDDGTPGYRIVKWEVVSGAEAPTEDTMNLLTDGRVGW